MNAEEIDLEKFPTGTMGTREASFTNSNEAPPSNPGREGEDAREDSCMIRVVIDY